MCKLIVQSTRRFIWCGFFIAAGSSSLTQIATASERLFLCGGPQVREVEIVKGEETSRLNPVWHWRPEESASIPTAFLPKLAVVDDCKPTDDGKELLISSSNGGIAVVTYPQGEALFYASVPNAHSIALLPQGFIVAAASTIRDGNRLILFERQHADQPVFSESLDGAHGVTWDNQRGVLWALGDRELLRLSLNPEQKVLKVEKRFAVPQGGGHDLVMAPDSASLYVTTSSRFLTFDIRSETFSEYPLFSGIKDVKSFGINPSDGRIAFTQADSRVWWTYRIHLMNPTEVIPLESETYKIRGSRTSTDSKTVVRLSKPKDY